jgi:hypothetical protein
MEPAEGDGSQRSVYRPPPVVVVYEKKKIQGKASEECTLYDA